MSFIMFLDVKHYFLKIEQVQKGKKRSTNYSRKIKVKEINKLKVWFLNQK